jgi:hypothetical protein
MNSLIKLFLDKLSERIFSLIGSGIGSAASAYHAIQQAEQQSRLEDLARDYESDGKPELAAQLRRQAASLANGDPCVAGQHILQQVVQPPGEAALRLDSPPEETAAKLPPARPRRGRRGQATDAKTNKSGK